MTVTLDKSHELKGNGYLLGVGGENESEQLIINIAYDALLDKWAYIEFEQNNKKYTTERLTVVDGQIIYTLTNSVLVQGLIDVQVVFRDANGFNWKSFKRRFLISDEINATESLPEQHPDFISNAQKVLDEINIQADKIDGVLSTEAERVAAETQRAENEATRLANETERETTERERKAAETARKTAEEQRQINEAGRVDAETARRTEFSGWANSIGNLNTYDKRLINLEEAGVGTLFDYVTDDTTAYVKTVPAKALPYARLNKVGGVNSIYSVGKNLFAEGNISGVTIKEVNLSKPLPAGTYTFSAVATSNDTDADFCVVRFYSDGVSVFDIWNGTRETRYSKEINVDKKIDKIIFYASSNAVKSEGDTFAFTDIQIEKGTTATEYEPYKANTYAIPDAIKALVGYGLGIDETTYNYIGFERKAFTKKVAALTITKEMVTVASDNYSNIVYFGIPKPTDFVGNGNLSEGKITSSKFDVAPTTWEWDTADKIGKLVTNANAWHIWVGFKKGTTLEQASEEINGLQIIYELATPIETDISAYLTDNYIKANGSIVFENDAAQAVPSDITFIVKR